MAVDAKAPQADIIGLGNEGIASAGGYIASVIDLGFNSAKLATYHVNGRTSYRLISQEDAKVKLGEELDDTGFLAVPAMERALRVMKMFREIVDFESPRYVLPVATSAVREAANKGEFLQLSEQTSKFKFRVLSEQEEALLSYFGAVLALRIPTGVFFDLGGGTLAIVYAEEYKVKKIMCLPLGARRLSYLYGTAKKGGLIMKKDYERMKEHILELLPTRKELRLPKGTKMVGVGGTVRAVARYHIDKTRYRFEKLHNYEMSYNDVAWTATQFAKMKRREMKSLQSMKVARAETMAAGSCVVRLLMKNLGISELVTSSHGLREGTLALFLHDHRWFNAKSFEQVTIDRQLASAGKSSRTTWERHLSELFIAGIITEDEYTLLLESYEIASNAPQVADLRARFHELMAVDSSLSHVDQLKVAIAVIVSASESFAKALVKESSPPLKRKDTRTVTRISAVYFLLDLLEKMRARLSISGSASPSSARPLRMDISVGGTYAEELLARAISALRDEFKTDIDYSVVREKGLLGIGSAEMIPR
jgi:exopolyphosphatase/guanosine-5'-triphosphate,3'-diphosphate pyrophosphatase